MLINTQAACKLLLDHDNIVILAHQKPDGDTLGSSFALLYALESLGKTARVECADGYPVRYSFLYGDYAPAAFKPAYIVAADVASTQLLGTKAEEYARVDLCIDHHKSHVPYAVHTLLDADSPATAQIMYKVVRGLGVVPDKRIANAIFTGLSTDTGCFKYPNVNSTTHHVAAEMIDCGAEHGKINKLMFDTKSRGRLEIDKLMMENMSFYFDGRCALITLPADIMETYGVTEDELDGISAFPRRIDGVLCGVSVRAKPDGTYRVSMRTESPIDASKICSAFGGGGHMAAAGCTMKGTLEAVKARILSAVEKELAAG